MNMIRPEPPFQSEASDQYVIGHYLMAGQHITPIQIAAAVRQAYRVRTRVGMVLLQQGLVSPITLADALVAQSLDRLAAGLPMRYIGERLLAHGLITPDQFAAALYSQLVRAQQGNTTPLGQLLVAQGVLTSERLRAVLADDTAPPASPMSITRPAIFPQGIGGIPFAPETALVLDDEPLIGHTVTTLIQQTTGLRTHSLARVAEAQHALQRALPRLIVLDRRIPDGDGLMLAARVRASSDVVAVILMTADASPALISLIRAARIHQYVAKPFDVPTIIRAVRSALQETATGAQFAPSSRAWYHSDA